MLYVGVIIVVVATVTVIIIVIMILYRSRCVRVCLFYQKLGIIIDYRSVSLVRVSDTMVVIEKKKKKTYSDLRVHFTYACWLRTCVRA